MRINSSIHRPDAKQAGSVETRPLTVGEPFNPSRKVCGFYPPEFVWKLPDLRDGEKHTYQRLVRYAGQNGLCWPKQRALREELLVTVRQVQRRLKKLESAGLIRRRKIGKGRGRGVLTHYQFLWHAAFLESKPKVEADLYNATCESRSSGLQGDMHDRYKATCMSPPLKEESSTLESSHFSIEGPAAELPARSCHGGGDESTTNPPNMGSENPEPAQPSRQWDAADIADLRTHLQQHRGADQPPDLAITQQILELFESREDCQRWGISLYSRHRGRVINSYGFYVTDLKKFWPALRDEHSRTGHVSGPGGQETDHLEPTLQPQYAPCQSEVSLPSQSSIEPTQEETEAAAAEERPAAQELVEAPRLSSTAAATPDPSDSVGASRPRARNCRKCHNGGLVYRNQPDGPPFYSWCDCEHATLKMQEKGAEWAAKRTAEEEEFWNKHNRRPKTEACSSAAPLSPPEKIITAADFEPFLGQRKSKPAEASASDPVASQPLAPIAHALRLAQNRPRTPLPQVGAPTTRKPAAGAAAPKSSRLAAMLAGILGGAHSPPAIASGKR